MGDGAGSGLSAARSSTVPANGAGSTRVSAEEARKSRVQDRAHRTGLNALKRAAELRKQGRALESQAVMTSDNRRYTGPSSSTRIK